MASAGQIRGTDRSSSGNVATMRLSPANVAANWWARQDSNLQPDGYEPPALTIELRAPLRTSRSP